MNLHWKFKQYMAPADDKGAGGGGSGDDRGDAGLGAGAPKGADDAAKADAEAEAKKIAEEAAAKEAADKAAAEKADKDEKEGKGKVIPLDRHEAVLAKARERAEAAEAALAAERGQKKTEETNEKIKAIETKVTAKEAEYAKMITDGEHEKAAKLMGEIRAMERDIMEQRSEIKAQAVAARAADELRYQTVVTRLEGAYPVLNPDHEDFDKEKVAEVMDLHAAYMATGKYAAYESLQKAVKLIMGAETKKQETATEDKPRVNEADLEKAKREEESRKKALEAAGKTPPSTTKVGQDSDKKGGGAITGDDVMKMGQEEFAKLNPETLAQLRGDTVS